MKGAFHDKCMHILIDFDTSVLDSDNFLLYMFTLMQSRMCKVLRPWTPIRVPLGPPLGPMFSLGFKCQTLKLYDVSCITLVQFS